MHYAMVRTSNKHTLWMAVAILATASVLIGGEKGSGGFGIGPGMILVENIVPGAAAVNVGTANGGVSFDVSNGTEVPQVFTLAVLKPSQAIGKWEMGYEEIPDASWCTLEKNEIEVPANTEKKVTMSVKVPDKPEYYNRKWMAVVVCSPGKAKQGVVGLRVASRVQIETIVRADTDGAAAGPTALTPSILVITDALPSLKIPMVLKVRNNAEATRNFTIKHIADVESDATKHPRYFGTGYLPVISPGWVGIDGASFALNKAETKELAITVAIPSSAERGKKYEELVFLQDEKGNLDFFRVRVEMAKPAAQK